MLIKSPKIMRMKLTSLSKVISDYTDQSTINENCTGFLTFFEDGDFDEFKYCCGEICEWYKANMQSILTNEYVYNEDEHKELKRFIGDLYDDILLNEEEYQKFFDKIKQEKGSDKSQKVEHQKSEFNNSVFVVHGRDIEAKEKVNLFLLQIRLDPIILSDKASLGKTIIEKIEDYSNVGFAIIIYTPDDEGYLVGESHKVMKRARQNVILEHGFFIGRIGRGRVVALVKDGIEHPNDLSGVVYINMDIGGAWRLKLANELGAASIPYDAKKLLEI